MGCCESKLDLNLKGDTVKKNSLKFQFQIYAAFKLNKFDLIKDILENSFDVHYKMPAFLGKTVLHLAAEFSDKSMIAYLIDIDADPNALDNSGCPPIFIALKYGKLDVVQAIYQLGDKVNINAVTVHGLSFHDFINKSKHKESVSLLKSMKYSKISMIAVPKKR